MKRVQCTEREKRFKVSEDIMGSYSVLSYTCIYQLCAWKPSCGKNTAQSCTMTTIRGMKSDILLRYPPQPFKLMEGSTDPGEAQSTAKDWDRNHARVIKAGQPYALMRLCQPPSLHARQRAALYFSRFRELSSFVFSCEHST